MTQEKDMDNTEELEVERAGNDPADKSLWASCVAAARSKFAVYPSAYANGWAVQEYKRRGGKWREKSSEDDRVPEGWAGWDVEAASKDEGLGKWFAEKWVDISRTNADGSHPACGRPTAGMSAADYRKSYPKCVPASKAAGMSSSSKKSAVDRKRNADNAGGSGKGQAPKMVSTKAEVELAKGPSAVAADKDPRGGLSAAGRKKFGVKKGVTGYSGASDEDKKRWVRWALRFTKTARPLRDDKGRPTRYALMFRAWGEPVPASAGAVSAVHTKALTRRKQLGMGQDSEKAAFDIELAGWEVEVELTLRERIQAAYGSADGARQHAFIAGGDGGCMSCGRPQVAPVHDLYMSENANPTGAPSPQTENAYDGAGCMVALFPSSEALDSIEAKGDLPLEKRDDMHITLAFLRTTPEGEQLDLLQSVVRDIARTQGSMEGVWGGTARFNPSAGSDGKPVLVALPDLPDLPDFRQRLVDGLDAAGFPVSKDHGYTPHLTVAYGDNGQVRAAGPLDFDNLTLKTKGGSWTYPLTGEIETDLDSSEPRSATSATSATAESAGLDEIDAGKLAQGIDAAIDGALTLLRSTPDLPPYAAQAQALLQGVEPACDDLLDYFGVPDADDDDADAKDAATQNRLREGAALSPTEVRESQLEDVHIKNVKTKPDAAVPHEFRAAKYPGVTGLPRCIVCGQGQTVSGVCNDPLHPTPMTAPASGSPAVRNTRSVASVRERVEAVSVQDVSYDLPAVKAFLTEVHGRTVLTAPASVIAPVWEKALTPNQHMLWMQGAFVGAEKANRNGAFWSTADLQMGEPTVKHGPLNWLHEAKHVVGTIADAKLVRPTAERAAAGDAPHISAVAAVWSWIYPDEAFVIEQASDQSKLWYSMECVAREVACIGDGGCGKSFPYMTMIQSPFDVCRHVREKSSTRRFIDPTFLGGAIIVPPVRPGWGEANANVMREAASLSEKAFADAGLPDVSASDWELLMASVVTYAAR